MYIWADGIQIKQRKDKVRLWFSLRPLPVQEEQKQSSHTWLYSTNLENETNGHILNDQVLEDNQKQRFDNVYFMFYVHNELCTWVLDICLQVHGLLLKQSPEHKENRVHSTSLHFFVPPALCLMTLQTQAAAGGMPQAAGQARRTAQLAGASTSWYQRHMYYLDE